MKRLIRGFVTLIAVTLAALTASGCTSKDTSQQQLLEALNRQADISSYTFNGKLALDLGQLPAAILDQPYTTTILDWLRQSDIAWSGSKDGSQRREEVELRFSSPDGSSEFTIPVIHAADMIYVHIPLINTDDEYFTIPAPSLTAQLQDAVMSAAAELIAAMEASWFSSAETATGGSNISVTITQDEWPAFLAIVDETLPKILSAWQETGLVTSEQAEWINKSWHELHAQDHDSLQLAEGQDASIHFALAPDGFISSFEAELRLASRGVGDTVSTNGFHIQHNWENIGRAPSFKRDIPNTTIPIEELLKLIP